MSLSCKPIHIQPDAPEKSTRSSPHLFERASREKRASLPGRRAQMAIGLSELDCAMRLTDFFLGFSIWLIFLFPGPESGATRSNGFSRASTSGEEVDIAFRDCRTFPKGVMGLWMLGSPCVDVPFNDGVGTLRSLCRKVPEIECSSKNSSPIRSLWRRRRS
jgi:hypothetical protein